MDINTIIQKKRSKHREELTKEEIRFLVGKYEKGEVLDVQIAALMSYIYENGLTENEILYFVEEIGRSGDVVDLSNISKTIIDKHSTGGVGDKITLILMPLIAALGLPVAKISKNGWGFTTGTIDKLKAIPGFTPNITIQEFVDNVSNIGISFASEELNLAPVETKFYNLRNQIACKDCIPLIAISLMSLRVATGSNIVVFELNYGKSTYLKDKNTARRLGRLLVRLGKRLDKKVGYIVASMDEPIGRTVGNILELEEIIKALNGNIDDDVRDTVVSLASIILKLTSNEKDIEVSSARILEALNSGKALTKFRQLVSAQGGDTEYISSIDKFKKAKYILPVYATKNGNIAEIDADIVGSIADFLETETNGKKDINTGIVLEKKIGDSVKSGEIVAYVHSNDEDKALRGSKNLADAFRISDYKIIKKSRVIGVYTS